MTEKEFQSLPLDRQREVVRTEGISLRKSHLSSLQSYRDRLLQVEGDLESLLSSTLFLREEESSPIRDSVSGLRESVLKLETSISVLEENLRREESGNIL